MTAQLFTRLSSFTLCLGLAGAGLSLTGCGGDQLRTASGQPVWVVKGPAAFKDGAFYGVGAASNISSISLRRSTADAQARAELAKTFSSRVKNLIKNYEASTNDGDRETAEAHRQEATKIFTEMELTGVQISDMYYDAETRTQFSLARLSPEDFSGQLDRIERLSKRAKAMIRQNADKAFKEIDAESAARRSGQ